MVRGKTARELRQLDAGSIVHNAQIRRTRPSTNRGSIVLSDDALPSDNANARRNAFAFVTRRHQSPESGLFEPVGVPAKWPPAQTKIVVPVA